MTRVLFVHNKLTRFVEVDRDLLAERYTVTERYELAPHRLRPLQIYRAVKAHDLVFAWFASWHSLLPVLAARRLGKPSIVVVGGYDTACVPEANYGSQRGGIRKHVARAVIRAATALLTNSESARSEAIAHATADPARVTVIYHGVEPVPIGPLEGRERLVLTVGNVWRENFLHKGLLPFVRAAAHLPDARFVLAGKWCDDGIEELKAAGPRVQFLDFVPDEELARLYARASVYVQASLHEGFGLSVAEAMTAGCIPVVTRAGSLPEVVGETGVYTKSTDAHELAEAIRQGLECKGASRQAARERVLRMFTMDNRRRGLHDLVEKTAANRMPGVDR